MKSVDPVFNQEFQLEVKDPKAAQAEMLIWFVRCWPVERNDLRTVHWDDASVWLTGT